MTVTDAFFRLRILDNYHNTSFLEFRSPKPADESWQNYQQRLEGLIRDHHHPGWNLGIFVPSIIANFGLMEWDGYPSPFTAPDLPQIANVICKMKKPVRNLIFWDGEDVIRHKRRYEPDDEEHFNFIQSSFHNYNSFNLFEFLFALLAQRMEDMDGKDITFNLGLNAQFQSAVRLTAARNRVSPELRDMFDNAPQQGVLLNGINLHIGNAFWRPYEHVDSSQHSSPYGNEVFEMFMNCGWLAKNIYLVNVPLRDENERLANFNMLRELDEVIIGSCAHDYTAGFGLFARPDVTIKNFMVRFSREITNMEYGFEYGALRQNFEGRFPIRAVPNAVQIGTHFGFDFSEAERNGRPQDYTGVGDSAARLDLPNVQEFLVMVMNNDTTRYLYCVNSTEETDYLSYKRAMEGVEEGEVAETVDTYKPMIYLPPGRGKLVDPHELATRMSADLPGEIPYMVASLLTGVSAKVLMRGRHLEVFDDINSGQLDEYDDLQKRLDSGVWRGQRFGLGSTF